MADDAVHSPPTDGQRQAHPDHDPITAALLAAAQDRRATGSDAAVLAALQQAADYCRTRLQQTLDTAIARAHTAQQRFTDVRDGTDEAEKARRYHDAEAAMHHAEHVAAQVEQALMDLAAGIVELAGPALQRMQRALDTTQRLIDQTESS